MKFALVILETDASRQHIREHRAEHRAAIEHWFGGLAQSGKLLGVKRSRRKRWVR